MLPDCGWKSASIEHGRSDASKWKKLVATVSGLVLRWSWGAFDCFDHAMRAQPRAGISPANATDAAKTTRVYWLDNNSYLFGSDTMQCHIAPCPLRRQTSATTVIRLVEEDKHNHTQHSENKNMKIEKGFIRKQPSLQYSP